MSFDKLLTGKGGYKSLNKRRDLAPERFPFVLEPCGHKEWVSRQLAEAS
jgi:hypothetical protein